MELILFLIGLLFLSCFRFFSLLRLPHRCKMCYPRSGELINSSACILIVSGFLDSIMLRTLRLLAFSCSPRGSSLRVGDQASVPR